MNVKSIKSRVLGNLGANAYGQLITIAIQLLSVPLFLHYWGAGLYGEWLILSAIPAYLAMTDMGFASVAANDMTMRIAVDDRKSALEVYQSTWVFISIISICVGCAASLLIFWLFAAQTFSITHITNFQSKQLLFILVIYVLIGLQGSVFGAGFRAVGRYVEGTVINNSVRLLEWLASVLVLFLGAGVLDVAIILLLIRAIGTILVWNALRKCARWLPIGFNNASKKNLRQLFRPAIAFMAFPLGQALSLQGMVLIIGVSLGGSSVIIFTVYRTLTRFLLQMVTMLNQAIWPEISNAYGLGNLDLIAKLHRKASSITLWTALVAVLVLGFSGEWIVTMWTNNSIDKNSHLLAFLLGVTFINVLWQTSWVILMATNMHQKISAMYILSASVGLIAGVLLIPIFGVNGAALGLLIAELPLLYLAISSALRLVNDSWSSYIKAVCSNPIR